MNQPEEKNNPAASGEVAIDPGQAWCKQIFDQLDPDTPVTAPDANIDNEPEWVWKLNAELSQQAMPSFRIKAPKGFLPRETGLFLGQQCANLYAINGIFGAAIDEEKIKASIKAFEILEKNRDKPGVDSALKTFESLGQMMQELSSYEDVFEKAVHDAFKAALDQPNHKYAVEFFAGFAQGIAKPGISKEGLAHSTMATPIYLKLKTHRREVEKLQNYPALREFLIKSGLDKNVVGSVRRIQKLCERLGLRLGKRGRPPGS